MPGKKTVAKKSAPKAANKIKDAQKTSKKSNATASVKKVAKVSAKTAATKKNVVNAKKTTPKIAVTKAPAKKSKVSFLPKGYNNITPYMIVSNANKAIDFYQKVFGAKVVMKMDKPGGKIGHAELRFGDTKIMLADEFPAQGVKAPVSGSSYPMSIHLYTKNVDKTLQAATAAGATVVRPIEETFYGDRICALEDPFGHRWHVATHVTNVSMATIKKRAAEKFGVKKK